MKQRAPNPGVYRILPCGQFTCGAAELSRGRRRSVDAVRMGSRRANNNTADACKSFLAAAAVSAVAGVEAGVGTLGVEVRIATEVEQVAVGSSHAASHACLKCYDMSMSCVFMQHLFMAEVDAITHWKALRSFSTYVLNKPRGIVSQRNDVLGRDSVACPQLSGWMLSDLLHLLQSNSCMPSKGL